MVVLGRLKAWLNRRRQTAGAQPAPTLLERYHHYKRLLAANAAILSILADLQAKLAEDYVFDMAYVRHAVTRLNRETEILVEALIALSGGRYQGLREARERVAARLLEELAPPPIRPGPLALPLSRVSEGHSFGGKAEKLGELKRLGFPVPRGFAVNAYAQKLFFQHSGLEDFLRETLQAVDLRDLAGLERAAQTIRKRLVAAALPADLSQALKAQMQRLNMPWVAVRSSALQEDGFHSFAGQFESLLHIPAKELEQRYKEVLASQFTPRVLYYCHARGFSFQDLAMGVLVMEMVPAQVAGVLYTADPKTGEAVTLINAVFGLGSVAVGGHTEPDVYRVEPGGRVSVRVGRKARRHRPRPEGGVVEEEVPEATQPCLTEAQVLELTALGERIAAHFGVPQDVEWALDEAGGFHVLQARPLRIRRPARGVYLPPRLMEVPLVAEAGVIASRGAAAGPVFRLESPDVSPVPEHAVLVVRRALPEYGLAVGRVAAVVSEGGSATSHLATVLREAGVPALFGVRGAWERLTPGEVVTVDAYYGNIYAGRREELLSAPVADPILHRSRARQVLERVMKHITPLHLLDPRDEGFRPRNCRTYHDLTRFAHEKAMAELFQLSRHGSREFARRLISSLPLEIFVVDVGGGLRPEAREAPEVTPEDFTSRPMQAYWRGMAAIGWQGPRPLDLAGFMSVVMGAASDAQARDRLQEDSYAILAADYLNISSRLGYHFTTVDAHLGEPEQSYITLVFYGGGADLSRRVRRTRFLARVLSHLDFRVEVKGDSLTARLDGVSQQVLEERLEILGRLIMASKQLDITMADDSYIERYFEEFVSSGYRLTR